MEKNLVRRNEYSETGRGLYNVSWIAGGFTTKKAIITIIIIKIYVIKKPDEYTLSYPKMTVGLILLKSSH